MPNRRARTSSERSTAGIAGCVVFGGDATARELSTGPGMDDVVDNVSVQIQTEFGALDALWRCPSHFDAALLLAHGAGAGMHHPNLESLASELAARNLATLRFQFPFMQRRLDKQPRGSRESGSARAFGPVDRPDVAVRALVDAWNRLKQLALGRPMFAAGHSFGARMVSLAEAGSQFPDCRAIILASYPLHPPGKPSLQRTTHWPKFRRPTLFLSGTHDRMASPDWLERAVGSLAVPHRLVWLDAVDHGYRVRKRLRRDARTVFQEMAESIRPWVNQFV